MTVSLVTGGSGFIGQHLVDCLVAVGGEVRILDLEPPAKRHAGVDFIQGSITDRRIVNEAIRGVRHVYHVAAIPHLWIPDPAMYHDVNVVGTRIVFEAAIAAGVERVVHTSSATVLTGGIAGSMPLTVDESHRTSEADLAGHYARSKWRAERQAMSHADKLSVVVVVPTLPLGPGDRHLTPPTRMLLDFVNGRNPAYIDCTLNVIDVRDVAAGHVLACSRGRSGERYILNRHSLGMVEFLRQIETITGRAMPRWRVPSQAAVALSACLEMWSDLISGQAPLAPLAGTRMSTRPISFSSHRAETELDLPNTPLLKTLGDAIGWFTQAGHLPDEVECSTFAFSED